MLAELRESLRMALDALATHKLRSALTLLGVLVGVFRSEEHTSELQLPKVISYAVFCL